jgi:hypothetical protein
MSAVETEVIPPVEDEDGEDQPSAYVASSVSGVNGVTYNANLVVLGPITDDDVADALVKTALAAAQLYGSGAWFALQQRLREDG